MSASTASLYSKESLYSLLANSSEIRLLYLMPLAYSQTITCVTEHWKLCEKPQYEALSYEWGAKDTKQILFNGRPYDIRGNLYHALFNLRNATTARVLWIDALCINQTDLRERSHQVAQMGRIYSDATCVVVWLGLPDEACLKALDMLQSKEEYSARKNFELDFTKILPLLRKRDIAMERNQNMALELLIALSRRSYWTRLWIVQELCLARRLHVQCGKYSFSWDRLKDLVMLKLAQGSEAAIRPLHYSRMASFCRKCPQFHPNSNFRTPLYLICWFYGDGNCENVLDRVFGLASLAHDCCQKAVPIDYNSTIDDVFARLVGHSRTHNSWYWEPINVRLLERRIKGRNYQQSQPRLWSFFGR